MIKATAWIVSLILILSMYTAAYIPEHRYFGIVCFIVSMLWMLGYVWVNCTEENMK